MKQKTKDSLLTIFFGIFLLGLSLMMFVLAFKSYNNSNIDLSKVDFCKGSVIEKSIALKKGKINLNVFHFKINGINENFASYNENQNYTKLTNEIRIGNELNIYYKKTKNLELSRKPQLLQTAVVRLPFILLILFFPLVI